MLLGVIIFFVVSPKSSRLLRMSAIIALALIGLSLAVCGVFLIRGPAKDDTAIPLPFLVDAQPKPEPKSDKGVIIGYFVAFFIIAGLVAYSSKKEKTRKYEPEKKAVKKEVFQSDDENKLNLGAAPGDDESFDIGDLN